ncbi:MAG: 4-hydroxy-tetrahydrodipicolinate reductase [Gammaproteobacteria bacterium]|nr:MAG: 4-hydroxy-tetrahydrodipicolinate reductase [Gammaproteobacteria bacterium]
MVLAANTSRGIQLCVEMLEKLTRAIGDEADIEIIEAHHRNKKDAPSGTALKLGDTVAKALGAELNDIASFQRNGISESGRDKKIGFSVIRAGDIVGEHTVMFSLPGERIEIKHIATSRQTFSEGALAAAKWVKDQKPGLYSMKDVLGG